MKSRIRWFVVVSVFVAVFAGTGLFAGPLVLFDEGHAQTAGNADWVIDGAYSDFADVFKNAGCTVKGVKSLTPDVLRSASIVVLPEPNSAYTPTEEKAIVDFVNNGGGLYAIADHNKSDRNGDGIDSVGVLNRFLPKLGVQLDLRYFTEAPVGGEYRNTSITKGVTAVGVWGGTTVKPLSSTAEGHIFVSAKNGGGAYIVTAVVGPKGGRVVVMGDSSPYDDGTGDPHDKLYNGFSNPKFQHDVLAANTVRWLLEGSRPAPRERLSSLMADLKAADASLKSNPSEPLAIYAESCEESIVRLLNEDGALRAEFDKQSAGNTAFLQIEKAIKSQETFNSLHEN